MWVYHRLRKSWEFARVIERGKKIVSAELALFYHPNQLANCRIGISIPKKLAKKATKRNHYKRQIKHILMIIYKDNLGYPYKDLKQNYDLLIIVRPKFLSSDFFSKQGSLKEAFKYLIRKDQGRSYAPRASKDSGIF